MSIITNVVSPNVVQKRCTTLCDKVCQWFATGRWFYPGSPVFSTNKNYCHNIAEILLKVALNIIKPNKPNRVRVVMVSLLTCTSNAVDHGFNPLPSQTKGYTIGNSASLLSLQHLKEYDNVYRLLVRIMSLSGETCLSVDWWIREIDLKIPTGNVLI